ncbi:MAG: hypothetical protein KC582_04755 [Candidatus Magasanikbacteria bacterium]|nr:hypothetical protein [Candidatus Magasanikbacteria bacterium]MCA9391538.1 hypothetical protein [Candidatus Magasanikbacteria bacterium]USN52623.1 MAG: hypothetical protein H6759_00890 [Candidatus Nomurabacteria bacterium]
MNDKPQFEIEYEGADQYDFEDEQWSKSKNLDSYSKCIGLFFLYFSSFEHVFDTGLADIIFDDSHSYSYLFIKSMEMSKKIDLYYGLALTLIINSNKPANKIIKLDLIKKKITDLIEVRNKIAHARWTTLDTKGFVRVDVKLDTVKGLVKFRKYKITPSVMRKHVTTIKKLSKEFETFNESLLIACVSF